MCFMSKIIHRAIFRELVVAFFLTLAFLNSVLMMEKMLRLSKLLSGIGATAADLARIIVYLQPQLLLLTIPMSLLLATLIVYGRMNLDSETVILRASGMHFAGISFPVMALGVAGFLASCCVSFYVGPKSSIKLRDEITRIITARSVLAIEEGTFNTSFKDIVIIAKGKKSPETLEELFIYDNRSKGEPKVLMAREGTIVPRDGFSIDLYLTNGYINIARDQTTTELFFDRYKLALSLDLQAAAPKKIEFTPLELLRQAAQPLGEKEKAGLYLEFDRRLSLPAVCLILVFLGPPLSVMSGKSGRLGGLAIGLLVFTAYYMILIYGENLVMASHLPHLVGAWLSTAVLGLAAAFLFRRECIR